MNRYLLTALYVMAGCVVTIPMKEQGESGSFNEERCGQTISTAFKIISESTKECIENQIFYPICKNVSQGNQVAEIITFKSASSTDYIKEYFYYISNKIRAPGGDV